MSNFPFFRIFPQSWTGHYCGYCGKQHGRQEWRDKINFPGNVFNSKKCLQDATREKIAFLKKRGRNMPKKTSTHKPILTKTRGDHMLTESTIKKAKNISKHLQEFCSKYPGLDFKPKDVLPYLVDKRVFNKVDSRNGKDLRQVFRDLDAAGRLHDLIPQVYPERKAVNTFWIIRAT